ncbi:uncharacterized protein LOC143916364 isoform X2 [Arctopsyche grandis]|uniref:uncharacterized protein LOC143916364 isoform X2 n=1 Tax=Arctopsyche grandis TaxID=121162 RepID=UPI00406D8024
MEEEQKFLKRPAEETNAGNGTPGGGGLSPPSKVSRPSAPGENLTKFSVEIVQQLEFTTSAADSQPQQISTNVTVKALTNASVKSEGGTPLLECKREPDHDFADLDQCAAALEKDAAANFPGFSDLIGDEAGDEIITSDAFKDLISDISDYPEFMKDFDFEDKYADTLGSNDNHNMLNNGQMKTEDGRENIASQQGVDVPIVPSGPGRGMPARNTGYGGGELSPAAQTLKQMAEQHQHKQMGLGARATRSPYDLHDYLSGPGAQFRKQDQVKQEVVFPGSYKQYSPYSSPGSAGHGSPGYLPRGSFGGPSPPRPPSGPPPQPPPPSSNLHINQAQHLHISHPSHAIQVSAGQHMHVSGELQGTHVSVAAQQGMYFGQTSNPHQGTHSPHHQSGTGNGDTYTVSQSQTINFTQQTLRQRQAQTATSSPMSSAGSPMSQQSSQNVPSPANGPTMGSSPQNLGNMPSMGMPNNLVQNNGNMGPGIGNIVNSMSGMNAMSMSREQHAKLLQQQQIMRAQQAMHQGAQGHLRPPPPDYKASQNPLASNVHNVGQPRYPQGGIRRATHQAMPPSGPMMRSGGVMYGNAGGRYPSPAAPASHPEWRHHLAMQQQQQAAVGFPRHPSNMPGFTHHPQNQGGFQMGGPNAMQQQQLHQQQLLRSQQQMLSQPHHQQQQMPSHLMAQQNQGLSMQGQLSNINMSQNQSISLHQSNANMNGQNSQLNGGQPGNPQQVSSNLINQFNSLQNTPVSNASSGFPSQAPDFNFDNFLEDMPQNDSNNYTTQDLLNSIDLNPMENNEYGLNFSDIF